MTTLASFPGAEEGEEKDRLVRTAFARNFIGPHTSVTALLDACVCLFVCGHIPKI